MRLASEVEESSTIEEPSYKYTQLSDGAKEKVKQWWYEHGADYDWYDDTYERFKEEGYELGFQLGVINFSGFYSQGDGACWSGHIDVVAWLRSHCDDSIARDAWIQLITEDYASKHIPIGFSGHYSHSGAMNVSYWEGMIDGECTDTDDGIVLLQRDTIFKGMHYKDLLNIITSSDFPYKNTSDLAEAIEESARDYADELYKQLREEYEYITSEANLIEMCEINEWVFNDEGEMV